MCAESWMLPVTDQMTAELKNMFFSGRRFAILGKPP
jgi:hypothetical protein